MLNLHFRPRCSSDRPCGQGEVDQQHFRWNCYGKPLYHREMAKLWGVLFPDLYKCDCRAPVQATTTINARLQATMPGNREGCSAMLSVSIGALCFTFLWNFFWSKILSLSGHGSQLRDFPTTLKVLVIQVTSIESERRWKNVKQWISLCWANKFIQYVEENNIGLEAWFRCCRRRCADHSPCGDGEWGCEVGRFMKLI